MYTSTPICTFYVKLGIFMIFRGKLSKLRTFNGEIGRFYDFFSKDYQNRRTFNVQIIVYGLFSDRLNA